LAAGALLLAARLGDQPIDWAQALRDPASVDATLLWSLRLPRAVLGGIVGAALAATGSTLQGLLRNPLADPFVLGVSGGAAVGATVAFALGTPPGGVTAFALLGALLATGLVFALASDRAPGASDSALLTGVIFNAFAGAVIMTIRTLIAPDRLGEILYWLAGSLGYERPSTLVGVAALEGLALLGLWLLSGRLNLLSLGDEDAASLGVPVLQTRRALLALCSAAVGGAVALTGLIGFVGLIVPHLLRLVLGPDQRLLVPASALLGAAYLMMADTGARCLFGTFHAEPPVGVVTALLGGPFFLFLHWRRERALA
jgi:iron complex transport system permease protein